MIASVRSIWKDRGLLLGPVAQTLDSRSEQAIRTDLVDLTIVSVELTMGLASGAEADAARREAVQLLDLASAGCGPNARLDRLRRRVGGGEPSGADSGCERETNTLSALDHYDLGRAHLRAGRFREAEADFQRVVDERPQDFWPTFYQGLCAYRLGQFHEADAAFRTCIALAPNSAECYYNRARAAEALGHTDQARRGYSHALELDPRLTAASINRGTLAYKSHRASAAIADFQQALRSVSDSRTVGLIHFNLALAHLAKGDQASALTSAHEALSRGHDAARALSDRLHREP